MTTTTTTTTLTKNRRRITVTISDGASSAVVVDSFGTSYCMPVDEALAYRSHRAEEGWDAMDRRW